MALQNEPIAGFLGLSNKQESVVPGIKPAGLIFSPHQNNIPTHLQAGELVAQFKATVLLMPNGSDRVTSHPVQKLDTDKKVSA